MNITIIVGTFLVNLIALCIMFTLAAFCVSVVYIGVAALIKAMINFEGRIRTVKVWREAISDWQLKNNKGTKNVKQLKENLCCAESKITKAIEYIKISTNNVEVVDVDELLEILEGDY